MIKKEVEDPQIELYTIISKKSLEKLHGCNIGTNEGVEDLFKNSVKQNTLFCNFIQCCVLARDVVQNYKITPRHK